MKLFSMGTVEKLGAVVSIISFVGGLVAGFLGQVLASVVMLGLAALWWLGWLTSEILMIKKGTDSVWLRKPLQEVLAISSKNSNRLRIASDFLFWEKCTIVMWVDVPPKGTALRNAPNNRYLLAHNTGVASTGTDHYNNQFCLRYSLHGTWEIACSNGKADYLPRPISIADGLEPGWHHFLIAWDRRNPQLVMHIDGSRGGSAISTSCFDYWPENRSDEVSVGAWTSEWAGHYCETRLAEIWITDDMLSSTDLAIKEHQKRKPRA